MTGKQRAFLVCYGLTANISSAAKRAKVGRRTHYDWLQENEYALAFADARDEAGDALEKEARRRAITGTQRVVYYKGEKCGMLREYSDVLLIFLMKGANPEKYRENLKVEHSGELQLISERLIAARKKVNGN